MFPAQPNRSLIDGLAVLQALTASPAALGCRQLAHQLALDPTRVNRLAKTLLGLGLLRQTPDRKYTTGPGIHVLAAQGLHASGLLRAALPELEALHETGLLVALGVLWRDRVCYVYHGRRGMTVAEAVGAAGLYPAARSGIGQVLLASLDPEEFRRHVPDGDERLAARLPAVRAQGWAHVIRSPGDATLAVPLGSPAYASLALAGAIDAALCQGLLPRLHAAGSRIERTLDAQSPLSRPRQPTLEQR